MSKNLSSKFLVAGLLARVNQRLGTPVGFVNPLLYGQPDGARLFRDITQGDIGAYSATQGWDACTGLGSPIGKKLLDALNAM